MNEEAFDREVYAIELLTFLAGGGQFEGDQMGPDHTLDQISVAAELIEMGYMVGRPIPDGRRPVNIGGPGITAQGRRFLRSQTPPQTAGKIDRTLEIPTAREIIVS